MRQINLTAVITREGDGFVALCPELDIASEGDTRQEARETLQDALEGSFEAASPREVEERLGVERYVEQLEVKVAD